MQIGIDSAGDGFHSDVFAVTVVKTNLAADGFQINGICVAVPNENVSAGRRCIQFPAGDVLYMNTTTGNIDINIVQLLCGR